MTTHELDWNLLRYVLALARGGSLERAGEALGVDPSTVSRRIRVLETEVGARLFDRTVTGHRLTPVGIRILKTAEQIELNVAEMERTADRADDRIAGAIRIATCGAIASRLGPILVAFRRRHPGVDFELASETGPAGLTHRQVDLAIGLERPEQVQLASRRIASLDFGLYAAEEYLEAHPVDPEHPTRGHQLLSYGESRAGWPEARWMESRSAEATFALRADSVDPLLVAAASGLGLALLPCWFAEAEPRLVRLLGPEPILRRDLWLVVHRESRRTARFRAFADHLITELRGWIEPVEAVVQAVG